jgi:hypothetical protein
MDGDKQGNLYKSYFAKAEPNIFSNFEGEEEQGEGRMTASF